LCATAEPRIASRHEVTAAERSSAVAHKVRSYSAPPDPRVRATSSYNARRWGLTRRARHAR